MEIIVYDHKIKAINGGLKENQWNGILYKGKNGWHEIDFEICAQNYQREHNTQSAKCVGDRNSIEWYFLFYTSGIKTKLVFKKRFVFDFFGDKFLSGSKQHRFLQLEKFIFQDTKYTTYDLT